MRPLKIPPRAGWFGFFLHSGCLIYLFLPLYPPNSPPRWVFPLSMLLSIYFCLNSYPSSPNLASVFKTIFFFSAPTMCPSQNSCLKNSMDRRAWWAIIQDVAKNWTQLTDQHFHTICVRHCLSIGVTTKIQDMYRGLGLGRQANRRVQEEIPDYAKSNAEN